MPLEKREGIIVVGAGIMQIPAILTSKKMGLFVIATDRNPDAPAFQFCDCSVVLDTNYAEGHVDFAVKNRDKYNIRAAFSGADNAITVASIANAIGLRGISKEVAELSNNKAKMKKRWLRDGIPTPYGEEVATLKDAEQVLKRIGFPAMVKAVDNAASRGSRKITSQEELPDAVEKAMAASRSHTALVEEYVFGDEQSVETIVYHNKHYHCGMADRQFGFHPYHIETAHVDPSELSDEIKKRIYEVVDAAAESLGIDFGPAKADMILTPKGPMVLELPARLSGGFHSQYTTPLATGRDPIRAVMDISLGRELDESLLVPSKSNTSICAGIFPPKGRVKSIRGVEEAKTIKGVEQIFITKKQGDMIEDYIDNGRRFCWVITVGKDKKQAFDRFEQAREKIVFVL
ncbi:MAG: ATP-grasp domain-containing protein [Sedimentisphaerales bacterium]